MCAAACQARREAVERAGEEATALERAKGGELREAREALWARDEEVGVHSVTMHYAFGRNPSSFG